MLPLPTLAGLVAVGHVGNFESVGHVAIMLHCASFLHEGIPYAKRAWGM